MNLQKFVVSSKKKKKLIIINFKRKEYSIWESDLVNKTEKDFDSIKHIVKNYGKFNNYGYRGLYNGETAKDIANRKGISEKEDILC